VVGGQYEQVERLEVEPAVGHLAEKAHRLRYSEFDSQRSQRAFQLAATHDRKQAAHRHLRQGAEVDSMKDAVANPWAAKARALDRYRWLQLRERHGLLGSALRFAREALGDWWFGVRAKRRLGSSIATEPCDFLMLQSAPKVIAFQRKKLLIEGLRGRGHSLVETALQAPKTILRKRLLKSPPHPVPTR